MTTFDKVAILGGGAFGVALSKLVSKKADSVMLWARNASICEGINEHRHHPTRLSQLFLPHAITATTDINTAVTSAEVVIVALPMVALADVLGRAKNSIADDAVIVCTTKGIEEKTLALPCEVVSKNLSPVQAKNACFLSGPSFAVELAMGLPTALSLASFNEDAATMFQVWFSEKSCRVYRTDDVVGVCVGGALKNVVAIAAGACTGLGLGKNALASLITRGLHEITRLALVLGGRQKTLSGLSGAGDLILSCTDNMSRNHRLGTLLADGIPLKEALIKIGSVVEGAQTVRAIPSLMKKYQIDLPIMQAVYRVLYEDKKADEALSDLLDRDLKEEEE